MSVGDAAQGAAKRVALTVLSITLGIGVLSVRSRCDRSVEKPPVASFPDKVFGGGAAVSIEVEISDPGDIHCTFASGNGYDVNKPEYVRVDKPLPAGAHRFTVAVARQVEVSAEVHVRPPNLKKGTRALLVVKRGEEELARDEETSDSDTLAPNTAFFVSVEVENAGGE